MGHIAEALKKADRERRERIGGAGREAPAARSHAAQPHSAQQLSEQASAPAMPDINVRPSDPAGARVPSGTRSTTEGRMASWGIVAPGLSPGRKGPAGDGPTDYRRGENPLPPLHGAAAGLSTARILWDAHPSLVAHHETDSSIVEQYRAVRTWLLCHNSPNQHACLAVTSSVPREGKTVTTANLAVVLAEVRRMRVLAVDCDLRQGGLHRLLRLRRSPGLVDVLAGRLRLNEAIQPTPIPNLFFLSAGDAADANPAELINSAAAARAFDEIRETYHFTLADTPPVQCVSDVGVIGTLCTGVLMIVRLHKTASNVVRQSLHWLQSNNLKVLGCVATACNRKDSVYAYRPREDSD